MLIMPSAKAINACIQLERFHPDRTVDAGRFTRGTAL